MVFGDLSVVLLQQPSLSKCLADFLLLKPQLLFCYHLNLLQFLLHSNHENLCIYVKMLLYHSQLFPKISMHPWEMTGWQTIFTCSILSCLISTIICWNDLLKKYLSIAHKTKRLSEMFLTYYIKVNCIGKIINYAFYPHKILLLFPVIYTFCTMYQDHKF